MVELSCKDVQEILSCQLDGESTLQEDKLAEAHLLHCSRCSDFAEQMENLSFVMLRDLEPETDSEPIEIPRIEMNGVPKEPRHFDPKLFVLLLMPLLGFLVYHFEASVIGPQALLLTALAGLVSYRKESAPPLALDWRVLLGILLLSLGGPVGALCSVLGSLLWLIRLRSASIQTFLFGVVCAGFCLELVVRRQAGLERLVAVSNSQDTLPYLCAGIALFVAGAWVWLATRRRLAALGLWAAGVLLAGLFLNPLTAAYEDYRARIEALPKATTQRWRMCLSTPSVVYAESRHLNRWNAMVQPEPKFRVSGRLWSAFHILDGRNLVLAPWPKELSARLDYLSLEEIQTAVDREFAQLDREIERRLDGSFSGFLHFAVEKRPVAPIVALDKETIDFRVPIGTYMLGLEQHEREDGRRSPGWNQIQVRGDVELNPEEGYYTPHFIWSEPKNLTLLENLDGWDHNGKGYPLKPGARIEKLEYPDTFHSLDQSFLVGSLGARRGDQIRVTVHTEKDYDHAGMSFYTTGPDGNGDYNQEYGTEDRKLSSTVGVGERTEWVTIMFGHRKMGEDIRVRGFSVEVLRDGKVIRCEGLEAQ